MIGKGIDNLYLSLRYYDLKWDWLSKMFQTKLRSSNPLTRVLLKYILLVLVYPSVVKGVVTETENKFSSTTTPRKEGYFVGSYWVDGLNKDSGKFHQVKSCPTTIWTSKIPKKLSIQIIFPYNDIETTRSERRQGSSIVCSVQDGLLLYWM